MKRPARATSETLQKFATQANAKILAEVRALAANEGRQLQALVDEALRDLVEKRKRGTPRSSVLTAFGESLNEYDALYQQLSK
jgi:hypothetical protein